MILLLIIIFLVLAYTYSTRTFDYWKKKKVKHDKPKPLFGNNWENTIAIKSITQKSVEMYKKYSDEKVVGYYHGTEPELIIRDPHIVRQILNVDFINFHIRGQGKNPDVEPLSLNLFGVEGDMWKLLRQRLTPAFTTSKLKSMFPLIVKCAAKLQTLGEELVVAGGECDVRDLMARFTTEFIGACGFGIEMDTINDEQSLFREFGRSIFTASKMQVFKFALYELFPELRSFVYTGNKQVEDIFYEIITNIRKHRNNKPIGRNDFIDLLLELELKGKMIGESIEKFKEDGTPEEIERELNFQSSAAQAFVFFAAGFETSSSSTSFLLHQLAYHPEEQAKIQEEIDTVLKKHDGELSYEAVSDMSYLALAFKESMRMFPSLGVLNRICARQYTIPGLDLTIDPGVKILIPVQALHMDEKYFENPEVFRPERFLPENVKSRPSHTYLPFGEGPRSCIGLRLGEMQSLAGVASLLRHFSFEPSKSTKRHLVVDPKINVVQTVNGGVPLKIKLRKSKA